MNKTGKIYALTLIWIFSMWFSNRVFSQRHLEKLDHGLVAVKTAEGIFVSWRVLASEGPDVAYNLYRNGIPVNGSPVTGASNLLDPGGTTAAVYTLKTVVNGTEQEIGETAAVWQQNFIDIPVRKINGGYAGYALNDASVGDLDGDGQYEIVVKRLSLGGVESTDYHYLEAYELDGTFLWAANMGPNIYNDVEFNFMVWDMDGDGKAEVALRTSDGFIDGTGINIGDANNDGKVDYRYSVSYAGYRTEGPDYLSVLEGATGKELDRANYIPRGNLADWGKANDGGHRSTKCMFAVAYRDGKKPSLIISRGIYEKTVLESWDFAGGNLVKNWRFDSGDPGNADYAGQGFHNLTVGDVDNDGRDEVVYGSMVIDDDGTGLYSTKLGHGDAQHLSDIDPNREGLEYFGCLENSTGGNYRDARTGEILHYTNIGRDMGRAGCADITPDYPGMEMWGPSGFPFLSSTGEPIQGLTPPSSMNFFIWWDGDLTRELLDHAWYNDHGVGTITKYNNGANTQLLYASGTLSDNWTKGNPALSADILGDWREEVIWRTSDNSALRLYTTTDLTTHKIHTLMHDPQYRAAVGWQPNSYNQPPHTGFFLGTGMDSVPPAPVLLPGQKVWSSGTWDTENSTAWIHNGQPAMFSENDKVLFDISGENGSGVVLEGSLKPGDVRVIAPVDYVFTGSGSIDGTCGLTKSGNGKLTLENRNSYSGITRVWDGTLINNGMLENSRVLVKRFATVGGSGRYANGIVLENYANLEVSDAKSTADTLFISQSLVTSEKSNIYMDLSDDVEATAKLNDIIVIDGDLIVNGTTTVTINRLDGHLSAGEYVLMTVSGSLTGHVEDIKVDGLQGIPFRLKYEDNKLKLVVEATRLPGTVVWSGGVDNKWDLFNRLNWLNAGVADYFLGGDSVVFDDSGLLTTVEILGDYAISDFLFDADKDYTIKGSGSFTGPGGLLKKGQGTLTIRTQNSYTGATIIKEGTLKVRELENAGYASAIGAAGAGAENLVIDGGELEVFYNRDMPTDRNLTLGINDGAINVSNAFGNLIVGGRLTGSGRLIKNGSGTLSLENGNVHKGTIINSGTVQLADDAANISGPGDTVVFNGGTLAMHDNSYSYTDNCSWHIVVPEGKTGTLKLDSRSSLTGKLFGAGTLVLYTPWVRNDLNGDWSAFTGTIEVTTDDQGDWRINNTYGFEHATVILHNNVYAYNLKGTTKIGALEGNSGATLASGTWNVGYNNNYATYAGSITGEATIYKYGTGNWTLTKGNDYSGTTNIYEGTLTVKNTSGSATGSGGVFVRSGALLEVFGAIDGTVGVYSGGTCNLNPNGRLNGPVNVQGLFKGSGNVNDKLTILNRGIRTGSHNLNGPVVVKKGGTLSGEGLIKGGLTLNSGAIVSPGTDGIGMITCETEIAFTEENLLETEINRATQETDVLKSMKSVTLAGTLKVVETIGSDFEEGDLFRIIEADTVYGGFDRIEPEYPAEGLTWDLSQLARGYIGVSGVTSANMTESPEIRVYPNPGNGLFNIEFNPVRNIESVTVTTIDGRVVFTCSAELPDHMELDLQNHPAGIYVLLVRYAGKQFKEKLVVR